MAAAGLNPAFVLHRQPYRDNSQLVWFFTPRQGRLGAVVRGLGRKKSSRAALLQPFVPLLIATRGSGELQSCYQVEASAMPWSLQGEALYCGFYLNELLYRLLPPHECPQLFALYEQLLAGFAQERIALAPALRHFEMMLLDTLGMAIDFSQDAGMAAIVPQQRYDYVPQQGFVGRNDGPWRGDILLAIAAGQWHDPVCQQALKGVLRQTIDQLLQGRPLHSRQLLMQQRQLQQKEIP